MKTKAALFVVAIAFAISAAAPRAEAAPLDKAKKLVDQVMIHLDAIAGILDRNISTPDKAIKELEAYFTDKKRVKRLVALGKQSKALNLTKSDKEQLAKYAKGHKVTKKAMPSLMKFAKANPTMMQKLMGVFMKLQNVMPK